MLNPELKKIGAELGKISKILTRILDEGVCVYEPEASPTTDLLIQRLEDVEEVGKK